jgi:putative N6-adenine-specific DNA methylase
MTGTGAAPDVAGGGTDHASGLWLVAPPGLEPVVAAEARAAGFHVTGQDTGGVALVGGLAQAMRANLVLATPSRVLWRIGAFRAPHLAMLDKRARRFPWSDHLRPDIPVRVAATVRASRIWHAGAAAQRIATAITETLGAPVLLQSAPDDATDPVAPPHVALKARIDDDLVTLSLDTSGAGLWHRGYRPETAKAPLRESLAAAFLHQAGWDRRAPLIDPMCGSGTFPIEAAGMALGLAPGRARSFAFEHLAPFDPAAWAVLKADAARPVPPDTPVLARGQDRDDGAIRAATANAARAGLAAATAFARQAISELVPPPGSPGLIITNPPWGARIGQRKPLFALYGSFGRVLAERFAGWRVAVLCPDAGLVGATGLGLAPAGPPVDIGGIKARLWLGRIP